MKVLRLVVLGCVSTAFLAGQDTFEGVKRIVAVGDVHGGFEEFVEILRAAAVIDRNHKWIGRSTYLVQTGDVVDRGPASRKVLDLLANLEPQALKAAGRVIPLIGNHEAMNLYGDLRYVSPAEYDSYREANSSELRDSAYDALASPVNKGDPEYKTTWYAEHPPGWVEHRQAFGWKGRYGKAIRERNAVVKINQILFLHAGISEKYMSLSVSEINRRVREELNRTQIPPETGIVRDALGPLWFRHLATDPENEMQRSVDRILAAMGVTNIVVGHTPTRGAVMPRFSRKVILIDVGLSRLYNSSPACLIVENGKFFALHRGGMLELPEGNPARYLLSAAELDPPGTALRKSLGLP